MSEEVRGKIRPCMEELQRCVERGGLTRNPYSVPCLGRLRMRLGQELDLKDPALAMQARVRELGGCISEVELTLDDTMHVSQGCMTAMRRCTEASGVAPGRFGLAEARAHAQELSRFIEGSGLLGQG